MLQDRRLLIATFAAMLFASGNLSAAEPTLKDAYHDNFLVGTALGTKQIMGEEPGAMKLAARQFSAITPENCLKWEAVHPQPKEYDFAAADMYVEWGEVNGMFIVGHTLLWHNQTPPWAFEGVAGKPLDRDTALARIKDHISTVVGRYKGRIDGWDVVNEAINDEGQLRTGPVGAWPRRGEPWHAAIGDDYIEQAFRIAHAADPNAELYYNDYNEWYPAKIEAISKLITDLKSKGVRVDGLGLQGHWGLDYPTLDEIDHMFTEYGKLGVKLLITELDVSVLPMPGRRTGAEVTDRAEAEEAGNPYADGLPPGKQQELAQRYADIFKLFKKHADKIDRVTFWGVHDGQSWRNGWPVGNRVDYPLVFDRQYQGKPAFDAIIEVAKEK
ncbi:MAG: endo-1,4-beta-xylanase [Pirellulales bacterium]